MTDAEYSDIVQTHGRRVANRAVLLQTEGHARLLSDFHDCYGPEDELPSAERCRTGLIDTFDPSGWCVHYPLRERNLPRWHEPEGASAAEAPQDADAATNAARLRADVSLCGRQIWSAVAVITNTDEQARRAAELIAEHAARLAVKHEIKNGAALYNDIVEATNACMAAGDEEGD